MNNSRMEFDQQCVTLSRVDRQSLLQRLLGRSGSSSHTEQDRRISFALADLRAIAERQSEPLDISDERIVLTHKTLSEVTAETAEVLGLPPLVDLTLKTDVKGLLGSPDFRLTHAWYRAGRKELAQRTGAILQTSGSGAAGLRRLPRWVYDALEISDGFVPGADLDRQWEALARFRRALEPGVQMDARQAEARLAMADFLSGLEVTLTDRFSISPKDDDQFDVVPFSHEAIEAAEESGAEITEAMADVTGERLLVLQERVRNRGARPAYKLGPQSYLVVDPMAAPALQVMAEMQHEDAEKRRAFIRNPRQRITEAVTALLRQQGKLEGLTGAQEEEAIDQVAGPTFVETHEYSARVVGKTIYQKPAIDFSGSGTTWLPEIFDEEVREKVAKMSAGDIREVLTRFDEAAMQGQTTLDMDGVAIPVTTASKAALAQRLEAIETDLDDANRPVSADNETPAEDGEDDAGPIILQTEDNLEEVRWAAKIQPRQARIPITVPEVVKANLKDHQIDSFNWKVEAWQAGLPGILNADEQGLGKTLQAISFLAWMKENMSHHPAGQTGPVLVVAPTTLLENWELEVDKHLRPPALGNIIRLYGSGLGGKKRAGTRGIETQSGDGLLDFSELHEAIREGRGHRYWVLTTYTTLTNYQHSLAEIPFSTAVFDEIQALKNPTSLRALAAMAINANFRIGLTGTPIENSTLDLWAIMEQLTPGRLGALPDYRREYGEPDHDNMERLFALTFQPCDGLPPVALRRLKDQVAKDLPRKERQLHPRLMPAVQASMYEEARSKLASGHRGSALKMLHHIRSVSVHPQGAAMVEDSAYIAMSARLQAALELLRQIRDRRERALVFIEHVQIQHRFIELLKREFGLPKVDLINGQTPIRQRQEIVNRFQGHLTVDRGFDVLVLGPKAAGTGLTLTAATHVIHLSRWWNPAVEEQCNDRVHRIGQTRPVTVHVPMAIHPDYQHNSFDCLLHGLMTRKRQLASAALWPMGDTAGDTDRLQAQLAEELSESTANGDPVHAAIMRTFEREHSKLPEQIAERIYRYE